MKSPRASEFLGDILVGGVRNLTQQGPLTDLEQTVNLCYVKAKALSFQGRGDRDTRSQSKPQGNLPRIGLGQEGSQTSLHLTFHRRRSPPQRKRPATKVHQVSPLGHVKSEELNPTATQPRPSLLPHGIEMIGPLHCVSG